MSNEVKFQDVFNDTVILFNTFMCEEPNLSMTEEDLYTLVTDIIEPSDYEPEYNVELMKKLMSTSDAIKLEDGIYVGVGTKAALRAMKHAKEAEQAEKERSLIKDKGLLDAE